MTSSTPTTQHSNQAESWEAHLKIIQSEEKFQKLTPEQRAQRLAEEKIKFDQSKSKLREDLGYKPFIPTSLDSGKQKAREEAEQEAELAEAEKLLKGDGKSDHIVDSSEKDGSAESGKQQSEEIKNAQKEFEKPEVMKKFLELFADCEKKINEKIPVKFPTFSLNDFGNTVEQSAHFLKMVDHTQHAELKSDQIKQRLTEKKSSPLNIGLVVEIGQINDNSQNLKNLSMEIPLVSMMNGSLTEQLKNFTNTVLLAMVCYDRQKHNLPPVKQDKPDQTKKEEPKPVPVTPTAKKAGINEIMQGGNVVNTNGGLEIGDTSTITFRCNDGFVWGNFNVHRAAQNPKELPEVLDRITKEK